MQELLRVAPERPPPQKKGKGVMTSTGDEVTSEAADENALEDDGASSPPGERRDEPAATEGDGGPLDANLWEE